MLHKALRLLRVFHDKSQTQLSRELGISKSHLSEIEHNKKLPSLELLKKYAEVFNVPLSSILFFAENVNQRPKARKLRSAIARKIIKILEMIDEEEGKETESTTKRKISA
jgi:transcriptional regulator with XRE-family HTH domain